MVRYYWRIALVLVLAWTSLSLGQGANPGATPSTGERLMTVQEPGKAPVKCRIHKVWRTPEGDRALLVQSVETGEWITVVAGASATPISGPGGTQAVQTRIYHWGKGNTPPPGSPTPPQDAIGPSLASPTVSASASGPAMPLPPGPPAMPLPAGPTSPPVISPAPLAEMPGKTLPVPNDGFAYKIVEEPGHPPQTCRVLKSVRTPQGHVKHELMNIATGETFEIVEPETVVYGPAESSIAPVVCPQPMPVMRPATPTLFGRMFGRESGSAACPTCAEGSCVSTTGREVVVGGQTLEPPAASGGAGRLPRPSLLGPRPAAAPAPQKTEAKRPPVLPGFSPAAAPRIPETAKAQPSDWRSSWGVPQEGRPIDGPKLEVVQAPSTPEPAQVIPQVPMGERPREFGPAGSTGIEGPSGPAAPAAAGPTPVTTPQPGPPPTPSRLPKAVTQAAKAEPPATRAPAGSPAQAPGYPWATPPRLVQDDPASSPPKSTTASSGGATYPWSTPTKSAEASASKSASPPAVGAFAKLPARSESTVAKARPTEGKASGAKSLPEPPKSSSSKADPLAAPDRFNRRLLDDAAKNGKGPEVASGGKAAAGNQVPAQPTASSKPATKPTDGSKAAAKSGTAPRPEGGPAGVPGVQSVVAAHGAAGSPYYVPVPIVTVPQGFQPKPPPAQVPRPPQPVPPPRGKQPEGALDNAFTNPQEKADAARAKTQVAEDFANAFTNWQPKPLMKESVRSNGFTQVAPYAQPQAAFVSPARVDAYMPNFTGQMPMMAGLPLNRYGPGPRLTCGPPSAVGYLPPAPAVGYFRVPYGGMIPPPAAAATSPVGYMVPTLPPPAPQGNMPDLSRKEVQTSQQLLTVILRDSLYPSQREWAAENLAATGRGNPEVVQALLTAAREDLAPSVRATCARCLGQLKAADAQVVAALQVLQADSDPRVRQAASQALVSLTGQPAVGTVDAAIQPAGAPPMAPK
ncbi:MAG: HEAT repeat domain-containing protein [Gemmataceae bacterium]|nr:HEAT repeat domain-containing protein [Gemmataceae bacterium]MDW8266555.1 HEAT repeat domain-containing protein [Gemmataceae bacterium]